MVLEVSETFESIQGEGKYVGWPALFIRVARCNLKCSYCDTKYALGRGTIMNEKTVVDKIKNSDKDLIVFTGGEPQLYGIQIARIRREVGIGKIFAVETNGTILNEMLRCYDYVCFSPKRPKDVEKILQFVDDDIHFNWDIKVVTDLESEGMDMIDNATMLMPLTTWDEKKDKKIEQKVWDYCVQQNIKFCLRQHVKVWRKERRR